MRALSLTRKIYQSIRDIEVLSSHPRPAYTYLHINVYVCVCARVCSLFVVLKLHILQLDSSLR